MNRYDRRRFLRGAGACIALPALEYFLPVKASAQGAGAPRRVLYCYLPNGAYWQPSSGGAGLTLPPVLSPLASLQEYITVVSGLNNPSANDNRSGDHARATGAFLTGVTPQYPGPNIKRTIDYDLAEVIGQGTPYTTLTLGGEGAGGSDNGYSETYNSNFSWASSTTPSTKETNPQAIFARMFRNVPRRPGQARTPTGSSTAVSSDTSTNNMIASAGSGTAGGIFAQASEPDVPAFRGKSVLDFVLEEAAALNRSLGSADKQKLDEYLTSVRDLEKRVYLVDSDAGAAVADGSRTFNLRSDQDNLRLQGAGSGQCAAPGSMSGGGSYDRNIPLLWDLMYHAFACDLTRVGTFMLANEVSNLSYAFAGIQRGHHEVSHDTSAEGKAALNGIVRWHIQNLANFLTKMANANLLDNTIVMMGAGLGDGAAHDHINLAILLAGRVPGSIPGGRHIVARGAPLSNLHLTIAQALGANWGRFGESTGTINLG